MSFRIVIPARFASSRLPGKPLREICGKPMIEHVIHRAHQSLAEEIILATDEKKIADAVSHLDVRICMTHADHQSGTERLSEVIEKLDIDDDQILINLQGDEPMMPAVCLNQVAQALEQDQTVKMATLCTPLTNIEELFDPHAVKVIRDKNDFALYFSRAAIPWYRDGFNPHGSETPGELPEFQQYQRHIGLYGYRAGFVRQYLQWPGSDIEKTESLEQLRVLYHGERIKVITAATPPGPGVDTLDDLDRVCELLISEQQS